MIIAMWSGPRNLSTAMMRSFGARGDCAVMDEPFFAPYLIVSGKAHPGREETLAVHETDPEKVAALCLMETSEAYSFQKHMPHHMLPGFPMDWAKDAKHFFLLRHPQRVIASYAKGRAEFELEDLGFSPQRKLWEQLGRPPVIHSETILKDPEEALRKLCAAIDIPFDAAMLSWPAGPRDEDGAWAPWWYDSVHRSTGFGPAPTAMPFISDEHHPMLAACLPDYEALAVSAIKV
jgi:hypothetical protein